MSRKLLRRPDSPDDADKKRNVKTVFVIIWLCTIFTVALVIRLQPVLSTPEKIRSGFGPYGDTYFYHRTAYNLYKGNGFSATDDGRAYGLVPTEQNLAFEPTAIRGPVYSFFICIVYKLLCNQKDMESADNWHKNLDKVRIVQCIIDASVCLLVFFIVRFIYPSSVLPAFIASALYCFCFYNIFYTRALLSESLTTFIAACLVFFYLLSLKSTGKLWWFLTGIFLGLLVL